MDTGLVISASAIVIALSALAVSIWQGALTRKDNRLSVTPHLRIDYLIVSQNEINIVLINSGLGPAIIRDYVILLDSNPIPPSEREALTLAILQLDLKGRSLTYTYTPAFGDAISPSEQKKLLLLEVKDSWYKDEIKQALSRIEFNINYESFYGDKYSLEVSALGMPA